MLMGLPSRKFLAFCDFEFDANMHIHNVLRCADPMNFERTISTEYSLENLVPARNCFNGAKGRIRRRSRCLSHARCDNPVDDQ